MIFDIANVKFWFFFLSATSAAIKELEEINRHFQEDDEYDKSGNTDETNDNKSCVENEESEIATNEQNDISTNQQPEIDEVGEGECSGTVENDSKNYNLDTNSPDDNTSDSRDGDGDWIWFCSYFIMGIMVLCQGMDLVFDFNYNVSQSSWLEYKWIMMTCLMSVSWLQPFHWLLWLFN